MVCWLGRFLNIVGRSTLVNSSLSSPPLYMLSFYGLPKGIKKKYDRSRSCFLWNGEKEKRRYHLVACPFVCLPKDLGGLGILDLELVNVALLAKYLWKLFNEHGPWQDFYGQNMLLVLLLVRFCRNKGIHNFGKFSKNLKNSSCLGVNFVL